MDYQKTAFEKNNSFYDLYLDFDGETNEDQLDSYINLSLMNSIRNEVYNKLIRQYVMIDHHCYECKKPLKIDVSYLLKYNRNIEDEQYLCDRHKNESKISKNSVAFFRYETIFMNKLRKFLEVKL